MFQTFRNISRNNLITITILVILYLTIDYFIFARGSAFLLVVCFQFAVIIFTLSDFGSWIMCIIYRVEAMSKYHEVNDLFLEVYQEVRSKYYDIPENIELCYDRNMSVNAYALGSNTIVLTRGAMETLSHDQIRGILAHEFGHLIHKDTAIPLVLLVGNIYFLFSYGISRIVELIAKAIDIIMESENATRFSKLLTGIMKFIVNTFIFISQIIIRINERTSEYNADYFAFDLDYGEELLSALKVLDKLDLSPNRSLIEKMKASHPYATDRIDRLIPLVE